MQNTSTARSTDFQRQKTITSKTPLTLYGRGFCASDRTPTTSGSPARPQSNQNVWVLPPISRNATATPIQTLSVQKNKKMHQPASESRQNTPPATYRLKKLHFSIGRGGKRTPIQQKRKKRPSATKTRTAGRRRLLKAKKRSTDLIAELRRRPGAQQIENHP